MGGVVGRKKKKRIKTKQTNKKIQKKLQNKSKHKNKKCFSWVNAVMVLSLTGVTFHLTFLGCPATLCWPLDLWWEQLRFQSGPIPVCSCLQRPQLSELVCFVLRELSLSFYIVHRHRVCLPDHVDLIWSLYSWWENLGFSSLATLPLGINCGFISISACQLSM